MNDNHYVTRNEVKKRYGIGNDKLACLMHLPKFPVLKIGGRYLIDLKKLEEIESEAIQSKKTLEEVLIA